LLQTVSIANRPVGADDADIIRVQHVFRSGKPMYKRLLLCYDGSREGRNALRCGAELAMQLKAETHVLAVMSLLARVYVPEAMTELSVAKEQQVAQEILCEAVEWLKARGVDAHGQLVCGKPMEQIPLFADKLKVDLIVVGHRTRGRLSRWWAGPENASLLDRVSCSILVAIGSEAQTEQAAEG
jgi:nucleotide-binding universal stress UspA family protein